MLNSHLKDVVGRIPGAAAIYDAVRGGRPRTRYNLEQLSAALPKAVNETRLHAAPQRSAKRVLLFATLHYWIEQAVIVGLTLRGMGHRVTVAYLPYSNWDREINAFDLQRQDLYTRRVLSPLGDLVDAVSLLDFRRATDLPAALERIAEVASEYDVMYSLQSEDVDRSSQLFRLRLDRNRSACAAAIALMTEKRPETVLIPNGLVTELGIFYQAARQLQIPAVTYEFNDQREQIWLAQNDIVMEQNTDQLWEARGAIPLTEHERQRIGDFEEARQGASTYGKGTRKWQDAPREGGHALRQELGLDGRPVALLATNVLGDSLTLGRNVFATSMAEWIEKTIQYFALRSDSQLVVRIHPGERLINGPSLMRVIERAVPELPAHIHIIGPEQKTNTYDVMELADAGLAYTTTVGMEMAMRGIPVIVAGKTHYRDRGFTLAPESWKAYFEMLDELLREPRSHRLSSQQVEAAWNYAYRFVFEYPFDFPWRLMNFWKDLEEWPIARVLSEEGRTAFGKTFDYLAGEPIQW